MIISRANQSRHPLRVLMQTRPTVFTQRGGDTIVLERLSQGLQKQGIFVTVDPGGTQDPRSYDLVHLYNFATPTLTHQQAAGACGAGVPFVVTTLYEDIPQFHTQSHYAADKLMDYVSRGQPAGSWMLSLQELSRVPQAGRFQVDQIAATAAALMPNGKGEALALKRDFPKARKIMEVHVGSEIGACVGPELFERTYGLRDFVFCVGRLESRKNQLMLLKALEHSDLPVVLAAGAFSYQPEYEEAIRAFKRKGRTVILRHVDAEMLSSAYSACRVHVLPSWYELPGLVSLEAAAHNKNIVVTRTGTTADYVGDKGFYCLPWDSDSIHAAVMAAFYAPVREGMVEMAHSFSWDNSVRETLQVYKSVVSRSDWLSDESNDAPRFNSAVASHGENTMSLDANNFQDLLERGERAAKSSDFDTANECLSKAAALHPNSTRVLKAQGAVLLAQSKPVQAGELFERALRNEPDDPKLLAGRGMCEFLQQRPTTALSMFERALSFAPDYLVALHQLLECSYSIGRYDSALAALRKYLSLKPGDLEIRFCFAGCLFKAGQSMQSQLELDAILNLDPNHEGAKELRNIIQRGIVVAPQAAVVDNKPAAAAADAIATSASDISKSLSELSDRINSWRVGAQSEASQSGAPSPDAQAEFGTTLGEIEDLKRAGEFDQARVALADFLKRRNIPESYLEMAKCLEAEFTLLQGDMSTASTLYDAILQRNSKAARAWCGKGAIAAENNEWEQARDFFNRAMAADAECDVAYAGLGLCEMIENKIDSAFNLFTTAMNKNPENNRALLGVLQTGYPLKRYSEMERMLAAFLDLHPGNIDILYSFAGVLFAQGKVQEAKLEIEKILIFEPQHENALELRGMIEKGAASHTSVQ